MEIVLTSEVATVVDGLLPSERAELEEIVHEAARGIIRGFLSGRRSRALSGETTRDESRVRSDPGRYVEARWRQAAIERASQSRWKMSVVERVPWRVFTAADVFRAHADDLATFHPGHRNIRVGLSNTLASLVSSGMLANLGDGRYAPAVDGVRLL